MHVYTCMYTHASNLEASIIYAHSAAYSHFVAVRRVWPNSRTPRYLQPYSSPFQPSFPSPPSEFNRIRKSRQLTTECRSDDDYSDVLLVLMYLRAIMTCVSSELYTISYNKNIRSLYIYIYTYLYYRRKNYSPSPDVVSLSSIKAYSVTAHLRSRCNFNGPYTTSLRSTSGAHAMREGVGGREQADITNSRDNDNHRCGNASSEGTYAATRS